MPQLTAADEFFYHQIPEPLPNVVTHHEFWRESLFFVMHERERRGDVVILTLAHYPRRQEMESLQLGRIGGEFIMAVHRRAYDGDPHTMEVGPVEIRIVEPYKRVELHVGSDAPVSLDVAFEARTRERGLRRGTMKRREEIIWDQSHMVQSGIYNGEFRWKDQSFAVTDWWGQRDHSWGIRDHARCPLWIWLAIQLPDGMISVWHWELGNGAHIYTDGCFAPADMSDPVPVTGFTHAFEWLDAAGNPVSYGQNGELVTGLRGRAGVRLANGETIGLDADGIWAARYGPYGGGLSQMSVRTDDGRAGSAIYEITGAHHHRYFPVQRGQNLPTGD